MITGVGYFTVNIDADLTATHLILGSGKGNSTCITNPNTIGVVIGHTVNITKIAYGLAANTVKLNANDVTCSRGEGDGLVLVDAIAFSCNHTVRYGEGSTFTFNSVLTSSGHFYIVRVVEDDR